MTKKSCLIVELILAVIAALVFFFYPVSRWSVIAEVLTPHPNDILQLMVCMYTISVCFLFMSVVRHLRKDKLALPLSVLGVVLLSACPGYVLIKTMKDSDFFIGWISVSSHREYFGILLLIAVVVIVLEIMYLNIQDKKPSVVRSSADAGEEGAGITDEKQQEYASILSQKTDEELKAIAQDN